MDLCIDCLNDLPWLATTCRRCGVALPEAELRICGACLNDPPPLDLTVAALRYEYPVSNMIAALKYRKQVCYARVLGELLTIRLQEALTNGEFPLPDVLVPVPLHPWRQMRRTFNQAELIAGHVARILQLRVDHRVLRRVGNTPPQMGLNRKARLKNLRGSFRASGDLSGIRIALVDDVITTCSTAREIAAVLKRTGAKEVQAWAVARAV
jgi:ComF family protein